MKTTHVIVPACPKPPPIENLPSRSRCGVEVTWSGHLGTCRPQPGEFFDDGTVAAASMISARIVAPMIESRIAPGTRRVSSVTVSSSPTTKTTTGQPTRVPEPVPPRLTGVAAGFGVAMKPASTSPMNAMNRPMPTLIACLSGSGIASMMICRRPVTTRKQMPRPSMTTRPMASGHDIVGAIWNATTLLRPRPAAIANGRLPPTPMMNVITAATSAVAADSWVVLRWWPYLSTPLPRMIGLRTMM